MSLAPPSTASPRAHDDLGDGSAWIAQLVLHLHRLDDDQRRAGLDPVARGDENANDSSRHGAATKSWLIAPPDAVRQGIGP
jgi:hypothetical protein